MWPGSNRILIIEGRALVGEMLASALNAAMENASIRVIKSLNQVYPRDPQIAVFNFMHRQVDAGAIDAVIRCVVSRIGETPLVILTDSVDARIAEVVERHRVRGWVAASFGFDIFVAAIRTALSGGAFLPSLDGEAVLMDGTELGANMVPDVGLTDRELEVLRILRQGKSNKIISFELNISESTTKVHISNIMRKLHVHNRTQIAVRMSGGTTPSF
ncbi:DNA-binding NarL/FixJ family response regulator [Kaistia dalseonensis]|uniref:DNA-binding NarL/FixJ family response regulator n=1 Tax=Kaistia dalseonensis TaxID=410840 RepID=A0ABU0HD67_9HYPH|nr:DNA-binding NarL/FixJ family response regulator [Kaistia dalseonensis]